MQIYGVMGERISDDAGKAVFSEDEAFSRDDTRGTHVVRNQEQKFLKSVRKAENSAGFIAERMLYYTYQAASVYSRIN